MPAFVPMALAGLRTAFLWLIKRYGLKIAVAVAIYVWGDDFVRWAVGIDETNDSDLRGLAQALREAQQNGANVPAVTIHTASDDFLRYLERRAGEETTETTETTETIGISNQEQRYIDAEDALDSESAEAAAAIPFDADQKLEIYHRFDRSK